MCKMGRHGFMKTKEGVVQSDRSEVEDNIVVQALVAVQVDTAITCGFTSGHNYWFLHGQSQNCSQIKGLLQKRLEEDLC